MGPQGTAPQRLEEEEEWGPLEVPYPASELRVRPGGGGLAPERSPSPSHVVVQSEP